MADKIPVNTTPEGAALWFAGCRCGTAHHHVATRNGPDGPGRVLYCRNCGAEVVLMAPRGEVPHSETPVSLSPTWTWADLTKWAKAELGESAIVRFSPASYGPSAETVEETEHGYKVRRFELRLELVEHNAPPGHAVGLRWVEVATNGR